jgi:hypothetical protein
MSAPRSLYDQDIFAWAEVTGALLRAGQWDAVDLAHVIEAVESVAARQYTLVSNAVFQILVHLLKWHSQPAPQRRSWRISLIEQRARIPRRLRHAPSLAHAIPQMLLQEYPAACCKASAQTGRLLSTFPAICPWTVAQVLDAEFWPGFARE